MAEWITDAEDLRIADFRDIRERDLVGRRNLFIAEGSVVLRCLLDSRIARAVSILVSEARLPGLAEWLGRGAGEVPIYVAPQALMDRIAGFPIHRGVLALGRRPDPAGLEVLSGLAAGNPLVLGLCGISNHDNMGGLFRNAAAFGVDAVVLDATCCDPFYRKAIRVSVGGVLKVPQVRLAAGEDLVGVLAGRGFRVLALSPGGDLDLSEVRGGGRLAVLLGAEGSGLASEILTRCETVRIPMAEGFDSLNVATTSGIVLHHLNSDRRETK